MGRTTLVSGTSGTGKTLLAVVVVAVVAFGVFFVVPKLPFLLPFPQRLDHEYLLNQGRKQTEKIIDIL